MPHIIQENPNQIKKASILCQGNEVYISSLSVMIYASSLSKPMAVFKLFRQN